MVCWWQYYSTQALKYCHNETVGFSSSADSILTEDMLQDAEKTKRCNS